MKRIYILVFLLCAALLSMAATESPRSRSTSGAWVCISGDCELGATTYDKLTILGPTGDANFVVPDDAIGPDELSADAVVSAAIEDGAVTFAKQAVVTIGASPAATCTAGQIHIDTDETVDTNCTTTADNSLCLCVATDTWAALENN